MGNALGEDSLMQPDEKPDGAPEWMVSYADMITIMMSFFVIMFAIASGEAEEGKRNRRQEAAIQSLNERFGPTYHPFASWGLAPGTPPVKGAGSRTKDASPEQPPAEQGGTVKAAHNEKARIRVPGRGEHLAVGGVAYFDETSLDLPAAEQARLRGIADELAGKPQQIEVLGYASSRPLSAGPKHGDRWDLAYARCRQVAQFLQSASIDPERIRIGVVRTTEPATASGTPSEDLRVDVYLTDALAEKFSRGQ